MANVIQTFPMGSGGDGDNIQVESLPTASSSEENNIYQYIGTTTADYINGYFYKCVKDGANYKWDTISIQPESATLVATLVANSWDSNNQQTLTFSGYDTSMSGTIGIPTDATTAQKKAAADSMISVVAQDGNQFTLEVNKVPTIDIPVCLICGGGGSGSVEQNPPYSTTPVEVGTWTDGSPIYQVVISGTTWNAAYIFDSTDFDRSHGVKELISIEGYVKDENSFMPLNSCHGISGSTTFYFRKAYVSNDGIFYTGGNTYLNAPFKAVIRYVRDH